MPITQVDIDDATNLIEELLGNQEEAQAYSKDPEAWLTEHGYDGLNPEAVAQCGASASAGGGAAVATAGSAAAASSGASAVAAVLNPVVYNHYYEVDNSITNNIEADGNVNVVTGDGNVVAGDDLYNEGGQIQTGDGIQVGGNVDDSNLNTGDDVQQAIDQSTNVEYEDSFNVDSHDVSGIDNVGGEDVDVDAV